MDTAFLIVVAVSLLLLSALIVFRMGSAGASRRQIAITVGELWLAFAIWVAILGRLAATVGPAGAGGAASELRDVGSRLAGLKGAARWWAVVGAGVSVAIFAHLLWRLGRAMHGDLRG